MSVLCLVLVNGCAAPVVVDPKPVITSREELPTHADCVGAATLVRAGADEDEDGVLAASEVKVVVAICGSSAMCDVVDAATTITVSCGAHPPVVVPKAPPGAVTLIAIADASAVVAGCTHGGFVVTSGADDGAGAGEAGNGTLDASEIETSLSRCLPASLSVTQTLTNHPSCSGAAKVVTSGVDFDQDGTLDENEIGTSTLVCDASAACVVTEDLLSTTVTCGAHPAITVPKAPSAAVTLFSVTDDAPVGTCPRGGFVVKHGADDGTGPGEAGNGTLDGSEVEDTRAYCSAYCGNGDIDAVLGETCDDGNAVANDGCSATCVTEPSCLPPSPAPGCPPASYHVETISPSSAPANGGTISLVGEFPANASIANTSLVLDRGGLGTLTLTATHVSPTELAFVVPAGGGTMTLDLDVSGADIPHWERNVNAQGIAVVTVHADVPLRYVAPTIVSTQGCAGDVAPHARDCSPSGGDTLRINGTGFGVPGSAVSVQIGNAPCASVVVIAPGVVECITPARSGIDVPVVVTVEGLSSAPHPIDFGPSVASVALQGTPDAFGTLTLTVNGHGLSPDGQAPMVELTDGTVRFPCIVGAYTNSTLACAVTRGMGVNLRVVVTAHLGGRSRPSDANINYPQPTILAGTIRSALAAPGLFFLQGSRGGGESIFFDASGLNGDASILSVFIGETGSVGPRKCAHVALHGTGPVYTVECTTPQGSGGQYVFVLEAAGARSAEGTDAFQYPAGPTIANISGCSASTGTSTEGCATAGGTFIDIFGAGFSSSSLVTVGGASCTSITLISPTHLRCRLPPGVGTAFVVVTEPNNRQTEPHPIGYARPRITRISGCGDIGVTTTGCPRSGGVPLTIDGENLGATGATVFVDGALCTSVVHDANTPHERLTCTLPVGAGRDRPVWIVNGSAAELPFYLSYAP